MLRTKILLELEYTEAVIFCQKKQLEEWYSEDCFRDRDEITSGDSTSF